MSSHSHQQQHDDDMDMSTATMAPSSPGGSSGGHGGHGGGPGWAPGSCAMNSDPELTSLPYSYENAWVLPWMLVFFFLLLPLAFYLRLVAANDSTSSSPNPHKARLARGAFAVHWFAAIILAVGTNPVNHAPSSMQPFDTRIVFWLWVVVLPIYLLCRDMGCGRFCCYRSSEFCQFQGAFWDFEIMTIGSFCVTLVGVWTSFAYHELNTDIGHLVPALGFLSYSGLLLYFSHADRRRTVNLVRAEGWMWITWGLFFDTYFTIIMVGLHGWVTGEEHLYQAFMYVWCGGTAVLLSRMGIRTGFPLATLCLTMGFMMMNHGQQCMLVSMMHQTTGMLFVLSGVLRFMERILEASFFMALAAGTFAFTGNGQALYADAVFDAMSYVYLSMIFTGIWWAYSAWLFQSYWHPATTSTSTTNNDSKPQYHVVVNHDDDSILKTEDVGDGV